MKTTVPYPPLASESECAVERLAQAPKPRANALPPNAAAPRPAATIGSRAATAQHLSAVVTVAEMEEV